MIDLSKHLDSLVEVTLRSGKVYKGVVKHYSKDSSRYVLRNSGLVYTYYKNGFLLEEHFGESSVDIIKVSKVNQEESKVNAKLNDDTKIKIATALAPEVTKYIQGHPEYAELMFKLFGQFFDQRIGQMDQCLKEEISCFLMDKISMRP